MSGTRITVYRSGTATTLTVNPLGMRGLPGPALSILGLATWDEVDASTPERGSFWVLSAADPDAPTRLLDDSAAEAGDGIHWTGAAWVNTGPLRGPIGPEGPSWSQEQADALAVLVQTAATQAGLASGYATAASGSAQTATTQVGLASGYATSASGSAQTATTQVGLASGYATAASDSAQTAAAAVALIEGNMPAVFLIDQDDQSVTLGFGAGVVISEGTHPYPYVELELA
jgi:hypothetical protein